MLKLYAFSTDHYISNNVYINPDLSKDEAKVAFEARLLRRNRKLDLPNQSAPGGGVSGGVMGGMGVSSNGADGGGGGRGGGYRVDMGYLGEGPASSSLPMDVAFPSLQGSINAATSSRSVSNPAVTSNDHSSPSLIHCC